MEVIIYAYEGEANIKKQVLFISMHRYDSSKMLKGGAFKLLIQCFLGLDLYSNQFISISSL